LNEEAARIARLLLPSSDDPQLAFSGNGVDLSQTGKRFADALRRMTLSKKGIEQ
jgi:hypothetical protein